MAQERVAASRTLGRGLAVLEAIGARADGATIAELCVSTGLDRAVVHRLLGTLAEAGFVTRDPRSRRYRLGVALVELGGRAVGQLEVRRAARTALRVLSDGTRESTCLVVRHGGDLVVVERVEALGAAGRTPLPVGTRLPLEATVHGRAMLALMAQGAPAGASARDLAEARDQGFAVGFDRIEPGLVEVAAAVVDGDRDPVAALGVVAPATRLPDPARLGPRVRTVAGEVSRRLGARG